MVKTGGTFSNIRQLLGKGEEKVLVIFTRDDSSKFKRGQKTVSVSWKLNPNRPTKHQKVVIYNRDPNAATGADLLEGRFDHVEPYAKTKRRSGGFDQHGLSPIGNPGRNWPEFADTSRYPIRYYPH